MVWCHNTIPCSASSPWWIRPGGELSLTVAVVEPVAPSLSLAIHYQRHFQKSSIQVQLQLGVDVPIQKSPEQQVVPNCSQHCRSLCTENGAIDRQAFKNAPAVSTLGRFGRTSGRLSRWVNVLIE